MIYIWAGLAFPLLVIFAMGLERAVELIRGR